MDFLLITIGSHGDVHPFVGIGRALRDRGHTVRVVANEAFEPMITAAGLRFLPLGTAAEFRAVQSDPDIWHARRGPGLIMKHLGQSMAAVYQLVKIGAKPGTVVVGSTLTLGARVASEQFGVRLATVHLAPLCIRSSHTMPVLPGLPDMNRLPRFLRNKFWEGADKYYIDPMVLPTLNALRAEHGMPPVGRVQAGYWHSPHLTLGLWPEWFFPRQPDYPEQVRLAGFPLYDEAEQQPMDGDLDAWIGDPAASSPPIAFTPGSAMLFGHDFFTAAVDACRRLGRRGLLLTRHAEQIPPGLPASVRHVPFVPFGTLLPRCAALVHHGGIGTTAQALRSGVPQLIMPMSHDQFDNAAICRRLGVAGSVSRRRFSGRRVAKVLKNLLNDHDVRTACARVRRQALQDRPLERVCVLLEGLSAAPV